MPFCSSKSLSFCLLFWLFSVNSVARRNSLWPICWIWTLGIMSIFSNDICQYDGGTHGIGPLNISYRISMWKKRTEELRTSAKRSVLSWEKASAKNWSWLRPSAPNDCIARSTTCNAIEGTTNCGLVSNWSSNDSPIIIILLWHYQSLSMHLWLDIYRSETSIRLWLNS